MSKSRKPTAMNHGANDDGKHSAGHPDWDLPEELKLLESQLKSLKPRPDRLARERLMFLAGQASVEEAHMPPRGALRQRWAWPASFATMTAVAATLFVMLLTQPSGDLTTLERVDDVAITESYQLAPAADRSARNWSPNMLSSAPYHLRQNEWLLAASPLAPLPEDSTADVDTAVERMNYKMLTPTSIHMLIKEDAGAAPSLQDSSFLSLEAGGES